MIRKKHVGTVHYEKLTLLPIPTFSSSNLCGVDFLSNGDVVVVDRLFKEGKLFKISETFTIVTEIVSNMADPVGLIVDCNDLIYVTLQGQSTVLVYNQFGSLFSKIQLDSALCWVRSLNIGVNGNMMMVEKLNRCVTVVGKFGEILLKIPTEKFLYVIGVHPLDGTIAVTKNDLEESLKFFHPDTGELVKHVKFFDSKEKTENYVCGINSFVIDANGTIILGEMRRRITFFDEDGVKLHKLKLQYSPGFMAISSEGVLAVSTREKLFIYGYEKSTT
jgi:hypothetical protein